MLRGREGSVAVSCLVTYLQLDIAPASRAAGQAENGRHHGLVKGNRIESSVFYLLCDVGFFSEHPPAPLIYYVGILVIRSLQGEGEIEMT